MDGVATGRTLEHLNLHIELDLLGLHGPGTCKEKVEDMIDVLVEILVAGFWLSIVLRLRLRFVEVQRPPGERGR